MALSPFIRAGTVSKVPYNHYSLLRTLEDIFDVGHLGYAAEPDLRSFGSDIFSGDGAPRRGKDSPSTASR